MAEIRKVPDGIAQGADDLKKWSAARMSGRWRDDPNYKSRRKKRRRKQKAVGEMSLKELMADDTTEQVER